MDAGLVTALVNFGVAGIVVVLIIAGLLVPGWTYKDKAKDAKSWRALYESERRAHADTRAAYTIQGERLQVAIETGEVTRQLLQEARSRAASTGI